MKNYILNSALVLVLLVLGASCKKTTKDPKSGTCMPDPINLNASYLFDNSLTEGSGKSAAGTAYGTSYGLGRDGSANGALLFNGTNAYATLPNVMDVQQKSISLWFNVKTFPTGSAPSNDLGYILTLDHKYLNFGYVTAYVSGAGGSKILTIGIGSTDAELKVSLASENVWNHLVFTQNGYNVNIYLNNTKILSKTVTSYYKSTDATTNAFILGTNRNLLNRYLDGRIDDFKFYNVALSDCQVDYLYKN
ncbi:MAG: LamG domain-containing protein [Bacteroidetes bacterium]|nr:LamG domain-containing protein [Bacteroidota bacterium]